MEPFRFSEPANGFLERVRALADRTGAVLIFDEITSGWRHNFGGIHLRFGVQPDIACFGKSLSNGFPMSAILGTAKVMQAAQTSFISSTFWTESIGPSAALATLRKMRAVDASRLVAQAGGLVQEGWRDLGKRHGLNMTISGRPSLCSFSLNYGDHSPALRTLLTQEMLDRGFLANTAFYPTVTHNSEIIRSYLIALDEVFAILRTAVDNGDVMSRLRGPIAHSGFSRLT
jgi:glutamate-1-semialdehyde aminotransferase